MLRTLKCTTNFIRFSKCETLHCWGSWLSFFRRRL